MAESLCKFPSCNGADCAICALMRSPRALTSRDLSKLARGVKLAPAPQVKAPTPAPVGIAAVLADEAKRKREAALQAEADRLRAEVAALKDRRVVTLTPAEVATVKAARALPEVVSPMPTAPMAPPVVKAPAPAPMRGPLMPGAWGELARRVDAGELSKEEGERIGSEWMANMRGVSARA